MNTIRYKIIRYFYEEGKRPRIVGRNLNRTEAQAHCQDPTTQGATWFDGYRAYKARKKKRMEVTR